MRTILRGSLVCFAFGASTAFAGGYAGAGVAVTPGSAHPALAVGYRTPGKAWRGELGAHFLDRERGKATASGALGPTISAERFDLKTRFYYGDFSYALRRRDKAEPSGLELGLGAGVVRVAKQTRVELKNGREFYSNDAVWRAFPLFRIGYSREVVSGVDLGVDGRYLMTGIEHGGKGVGGWSFAFIARFSPATD